LVRVLEPLLGRLTTERTSNGLQQQDHRGRITMTVESS
jgi:hypothetical protein